MTRFKRFLWLFLAYGITGTLFKAVHVGALVDERRHVLVPSCALLPLQGYHMQMVELFAEYDPMGLLPFLRASERYPLEEVRGLRGFKVLDSVRQGCIPMKPRPKDQCPQKTLTPSIPCRHWPCASGKVCVRNWDLFFFVFAFFIFYIFLYYIFLWPPWLWAKNCGQRYSFAISQWGMSQVRKLPTCLAVLAECQMLYGLGKKPPCQGHRWSMAESMAFLGSPEVLLKAFWDSLMNWAWMIWCRTNRKPTFLGISMHNNPMHYHASHSKNLVRSSQIMFLAGFYSKKWGTLAGLWSLRPRRRRTRDHGSHQKWTWTG